MDLISTKRKLLLLFFTVFTVFGGDSAHAQENSSFYITPFIAGGEGADIRNYPFMVSIQYNMDHKCGGIIISKNVVLTAAHCIVDTMSKDTNGWEVVAGRSSLLNSEEGQRLKVQSSKIHFDYTYNKTVLLNDIGLIWLKRRFVWSSSVQPANLSRTWDIEERPFVGFYASYIATTIGWGVQDNGVFPGHLHHVNQTIRVGDNCFGTLQTEDARTFYGSIMFCTKDAGKDACQGDSGGPVIYNDEVIGIVSHGYGQGGCGHSVSWKIKVAAYYSWIEEELKQDSSSGKKKIFCYYGSSSMNRNTLGRLDIKNIDPFLCTDLIYAFAGLDSNSKIVNLKDTDLYDIEGKGGFKRFTLLKKSNPLLKTWISIGGYEEGSIKYSKMASERTSRAVFIESVVAFLQKYDFDGVDIHWLFPGMRGGSSNDRFSFGFLLRELRESLDKYGFLLSVAVGSIRRDFQIPYNIPEISSSVHYIILLTHSYHGHWEKFTGLNAPLYPQETDTSEFDQMNNVNWTVNFWIANKADREKLILGIATFGRSWILEDPMDHLVGSKATGGTNPTAISDEYGFLSYSEICMNVINGWQEVWDNFTKSPYAYFENQWVGYDNLWSVGIKANFINELDLEGAAIWSLENDDFLNRCGHGKSPLTNTVKEIVGTESSLKNTIKEIVGTEYKGSSSGKKRIFCYYGSWSMSRNTLGRLDIENIDPFLCTDLIYAFAGLDSNSKIVSLKNTDLYDIEGKGGFKRFTLLKEANPMLKTWISIGGWDEGSIKYSKMASETTSRAVFIESVVAFLQKYNFDGVDIHWLYPGRRGGSSHDRFSLVFLLRELRESLDMHGFLLSVAVGSIRNEQISYNIAEISSSVHYIILLTHSYHGHWEKSTGINAPLYPQEADTSELDQYNNVNWTVNFWIANKADREKLILGIAAFGRSWILEDPMDHLVGSKATGGTNPTAISDEYGFLSYSEICMNVMNEWQEVKENFTQSPYAYFENRWVSYDNPWSVGIKANFINELELGGAAIWSLENDDFLNRCGHGKSPLTSTLKEIVGTVYKFD